MDKEMEHVTKRVRSRGKEINRKSDGKRRERRREVL